jgi:hypothetical protein
MKLSYRGTVRVSSAGFNSLSRSSRRSPGWSWPALEPCVTPAVLSEKLRDQHTLRLASGRDRHDDSAAGDCRSRMPLVGRSVKEEAGART